MIQLVSDFFILLGWLWTSFFSLVSKVFLPVQYIYTFLKTFLAGALAAPAASQPVFDNTIVSFFQSIPYFPVLSGGIVIALALMFAIFLLKQFSQT
jgi:hypothetical protein